MEHAPRPRGLLGDLRPLMQKGMRRLLTEQGCDVIGHEARPSAIVGEVHRLRPDIVFLDLDGGSAQQLGRLVAGGAPEATVVLGAREEDEMEVIDPVSDDSLRVSAPVLERLRSELTSSTIQRVEE